MEKTIYIDGKLLDLEFAQISVQDHGLLYGNNLFETMRCYAGKVFRLDRHIARLWESAAFLGWPDLPDTEEMLAAVKTTIVANSLKNAAIRLTVTSGKGALRPDMSSCRKPSMFIFANDLVALPEEEYSKGWKLGSVMLRRNQYSSLCKVKSANYLDNILARREAAAQGANEALLLNTAGMVAEGSISNIFIVQDGVLATPDIASGLLPGVTRQAVIDIAGQTGLEVMERQISLSELKQADEVFITNSLLEIMPVTEFDKLPLGNGSQKITGLMRRLYKSAVETEISGGIE